MIRSFVYYFAVACVSCASADAALAPGSSGAAQPVAAPVDSCAEARSYQRRAGEADGEVRAALQRIAETKAKECQASARDLPSEQR
jgi:hypothetical protein